MKLKRVTAKSNPNYPAFLDYLQNRDRYLHGITLGAGALLVSGAMAVGGEVTGQASAEVSVAKPPSAERVVQIGGDIAASTKPVPDTGKPVETLGEVVAPRPPPPPKRTLGKPAPCKPVPSRGTVPPAKPVPAPVPPVEIEGDIVAPVPPAKPVKPLGEPPPPSPPGGIKPPAPVDPPKPPETGTVKPPPPPRPLGRIVAPDRPPLKGVMIAPEPPAKEK